MQNGRKPQKGINMEPAKWVHCPVRGCKTTAKAFPDTVMLNFPLYCRKCKAEYKVSIIQQKLTFCDSGKN